MINHYTHKTLTFNNEREEMTNEEIRKTIDAQKYFDAKAKEDFVNNEVRELLNIPYVSYTGIAKVMNSYADQIQDLTRADERERVIQEIENWSLWKGDNSPREKLALFFIALNSLKSK